MKTIISFVAITIIAIQSTFLYAQVPPYVPANGLVSWWPFNGNANDEGGNGNNGTVNGATMTTDRFGLTNKAFIFNSNNYIELLHYLPIDSVFTIAFWTYNQIGDNNSEGTIINDGSINIGGNDFLINMTSGRIGIRADKSNKPLNHEDNSPSQLCNLDIGNKWVHTVWVMTPGYSIIYLNGIAIAQLNEKGTNTGYHDPTSFIGARKVWSNIDHYFIGKIDDIGIWNRALTQQEIIDLYNASFNYSISGNFLYFNASLTPIDIMKIRLKQNNIIIDSTTTTAYGSYQFPGLSDGVYTLDINCSKPWGGVNSTDAVKTERHFVNLEIISEPVQLQAADVNLNNTINATDAVKIQRRFVGLDTSFARGDWTFAKPNVGGDTVTVNGSNVVQNFYVLCVGDVNGSYTPPLTQGSPVVNTSGVTNITQTSATSGGNVLSDGGATVMAKGVCWSTSTNPTIANNHTSDGSGTGTFVSNINGLTGGTLYYIRAYSTNSVGTAYGSQVIFSTLANASLPTLTTTSVSNIAENFAISGGNITDNGGYTINARGVCWSINPNPTLADSHTSDGMGMGTFVSYLTGLTASTLYYVKAYANNSSGTAYGNQQSFSTSSSPSTPFLSTTSVSNITGNSATSGGNVISDGGATVTARGVCWSTSPVPTTANNKTVDGTGTGVFISSLTGLLGGTLYYVRAYATNAVGTSYGDQQSFTTVTLPTLTTTSVSNIAENFAISGGNITDNGGSSVNAKGVCWSTNPNPTLTESHTSDGCCIGTFVSYLTGLTASTLYYVRAYATNSAGTAYGNQQSFSTSSSPSTPFLTTTSVSNVMMNSATSGGNVISDCGATVIARGVCWTTSPSPTTANNKTVDGGGTGVFVSSLTGLTGGTLYYLRAYATNAVGTSYGDQQSFTTITLPTLTTASVSNITQTSATSGGNITDNGGSAVNAKGVCWGTNPNPTLADSHTSDGCCMGTFVSSLTGLTANTLYFARAYATNSAGTAYGNQQSFTTLP